MTEVNKAPLSAKKRKIVSDTETVTVEKHKANSDDTNVSSKNKRQNTDKTDIKAVKSCKCSKGSHIETNADYKTEKEDLLQCALPFLEGLFQTNFLKHIKEDDIPERILDEQNMFDCGFTPSKYATDAPEEMKIDNPLWLASDEFDWWMHVSTKSMMSLMYRDPMCFYPQSGDPWRFNAKSKDLSLSFERSQPFDTNAVELRGPTYLKDFFAILDRLSDGFCLRNLPNIKSFIENRWRQCMQEYSQYLHETHRLRTASKDDSLTPMHQAEIMFCIEKLREKCPEIVSNVIRYRLMKEGYHGNSGSMTRRERRGFDTETERIRCDGYLDLFSNDQEGIFSYAKEKLKISSDDDYKGILRRAVVFAGDHLLTQALRNSDEPKEPNTIADNNLTQTQPISLLERNDEFASDSIRHRCTIM